MTGCEPGCQGLRCGPVGGGDGLGVKPEGQADIGVSEPDLSGLRVDALGHHPGGVHPAKIMELETGKTCPIACRYPDALPPVAVVQRTASTAHEEQLLAVCGGKAASGYVPGQDLGKYRIDGQRADPSFGLGFRRHVVIIEIPGALLGDEQIALSVTERC